MVAELYVNRQILQQLQNLTNNQTLAVSRKQYTLNNNNNNFCL